MTTSADLAMWKRYRAEGSVPDHHKRKSDFLAGVEWGRSVVLAGIALQGILDMSNNSPETFALWRIQNPDLVRRLYIALR